MVWRCIRPAGVPLAVALIVALAAGAWVPAAWGMEWRAPRVSSAPTGPDDPVWRTVPALTVTLTGRDKFAGRTLPLAAQAAVSGEEIFFRFQWPDPTLSVTRKAWKFDGSRWQHQPGNEDRLSLLLEITPIPDFATQGCAAVCHLPPGATTARGGRFGTTSPAHTGDLWHWKAGRSDPVGHADDTWLGPVSDGKGGRKPDAGTGGEKLNETEDKTRPRFAPAPGKSPGKHGVLLAAEAVPIEDYSRFQAGDTLTYQMPLMPTGSRADIRAVSAYGKGGWTLMLSRRLNTGHEDDAALQPGQRYPLALAVFDDSGDADHYESGVLWLNLAP